MEVSQDNSQVYDFLYKIERRVSYLEKDAQFIEKQINTLDRSKETQFKILIEEINRSHIEIESIQNHFSECIHAMTRVSKELKNTVKKEEIVLLTNQIDEIKFEEYLMPSDLKREI